MWCKALSSHVCVVPASLEIKRILASFKQILLVWIKQKILPPLLVLDPSVKWER